MEGCASKVRTGFYSVTRLPGGLDKVDGSGFDSFKSGHVID